MSWTTIRIDTERRDGLREWAGDGISDDRALRELLNMANDRGWKIKNMIGTKVEIPKGEIPQA